MALALLAATLAGCQTASGCLTMTKQDAALISPHLARQIVAQNNANDC